jgi:hypothetical protein
LALLPVTHQQGQLNNHMAAYQPPLVPQQQPLPSPQQQPAAAAAAAAAGGGGGDAAAEVDPDEANIGAGAPRLPGFASVPIAAAWFKEGSVHAIERAAVPEFFNGSCSNGIAVSGRGGWRSSVCD